MTTKLLIIEDDVSIAKGLYEYFNNENYEVLTSHNGEEGYLLACNSKADLIILDLMLPGKNGMEICRDLRMQKNSTPILMLTSKGDEIDKIIGLEIGADDYVTKPFSLRELSARVKAILRRNIYTATDIEEINFDNISINFKKQEAFKNKIPLDFSTMEFKILKYFSIHEGEVITREMLLDEVWGFENYPTTRTVDNFILSLRKQVEENPSAPKHLLTIHKAGYKFVK
jgi:DNA-binding response OmpR family regulator